MQRIANLLMMKDGQVLLLKKPRRGWYVAPGGKMDATESVYESAVREFQEETGATPISPHMKGIYTMVIQDEQTKEIVDEWMLYTFIATDYTGTLMETTIEGELAWHAVEELQQLPMGEGDRMNLLFATTQKGMQYGTFYYTEDFKLLDYSIQNSLED